MNQAYQNAQPGKKKDLLKADVEENERMIDEMQQQLGNWALKRDAEPVIVLDFDRGHYTLSRAWGDAVKGWNRGGFKTEWSRTARQA